MQDETPFYELDEDTQKLLQSVLEIALMSANLQIDHKNSQSVMDIVFTTAHRFGIEFEVVDNRSQSDTSIDLSTLPFDIQVSFIEPRKDT